MSTLKDTLRHVVYNTSIRKIREDIANRIRHIHQESHPRQWNMEEEVVVCFIDTQKSVWSNLIIGHVT